MKSLKLSIKTIISIILLLPAAIWAIAKWWVEWHHFNISSNLVGWFRRVDKVGVRLVDKYLTNK